MLEQVYNIILSIPDTVVASIPSLRSPSVLVNLKRMRQKIKNKMKIGKTRLINEQSKSSISKYGSVSTDNSRFSTSSIPTDVSNDNNTNINKWFDNHSDFHMNTTLPMKQTSSFTDTYPRERLSVNKLDCIVNNKHFDSFSVSDIQKSIQSCSVNNNKFDSNKLPPQTSYEGKYLCIHYIRNFYFVKLN